MTNDNEIWAAILGGIIGAAAASPKPEEKAELQEYRTLKQEILLRQQKIGDLPNIRKLLQNHRYYNPFIEAYKTYSSGFYRSSVILFSAIIESLLREKYGDLKFYELIEKAKIDNFITETDYYFLHGIRSERNISAHEILREITEEDAILVIRIVNKLMERFT